MPEQHDKILLRQVFLNPASRNLLAVWSLLKGCTFDLKVVADLLSLSEDALENKVQALAGLGLIQVANRPSGERVIKFLPAPSTDLVALIDEMFVSRRREFEQIESRVRSQLYITLLSTPV